MVFYKFWQTQPVPQFDDNRRAEEGPIILFDPEKVSEVPGPLADGYEWSTIDLDVPSQQEELYDLLAGHYVEDDQNNFRLEYSIPFLTWALKPPGWRRDWHVCVRSSKTQSLVAFIAAVPATINIRDQSLEVAEIDFLCVHQELRARRLAPALIEELTRRCALAGLQHAVYTSGTILPRPISTCTYFHRPLNWKKLYDWRFVLPPPYGSTEATEIVKFDLPDAPDHLPNIRLMTADDAGPVHDLLHRYLKRFDLAPLFSVEEITHYLLQDTTPLDEQRGVWTYVVEDPETGEITDMVSFSAVNNACLKDGKVVDTIKTAFLYYYASETAFSGVNGSLRERLTELVWAALILAKKAGFDVFNALTAQDNPLFLEELQFEIGDGRLYYYLFNYRANPISGSIKRDGSSSSQRKGGVGLILL
ncbi:Glycylpeptide N-tetradecanoyltransferase [Aspergillus varians]